MSDRFGERYFEDPDLPGGLKGGDEVRGYGYYPAYFPIVEAQLSALIELTGGASLLDVGCGKGALIEYARRDLGVTGIGVDASRYAVSHARRRRGGGRTIRADAARLPLAAAAVDLVWCNGVLQYFEADSARAALAGMARVTRLAAFVSNIAAAQRRLDWSKYDRLTRLYLSPRHWANLMRDVLADSAADIPEPADFRVEPLPFEGESAILLWRPGRLGAAFAARFVDLSLERQRRLGALTRQPPALGAFRQRHSRPESSTAGLRDRAAEPATP